MCIKINIAINNETAQWMMDKIPKDAKLGPSHKHKHIVPSPIFYAKHPCLCLNKPMADNAK